MTMTALSIDYVDELTKHQFHLPLSVFKKPRNSEDYSFLEKILDRLLDEVRDDETHPLAIAMQIIGDNLEQYDDEHHPDIGANITDVEMVRYLMETNHLGSVIT